MLNIDKADQEKFRKLGIADTLGLALLIPHHYENNFLESALRANEENTIEATVSAIQFTPKQLKVSLYSKNTDDYLTAIYFHPKRFHRSMFAQGSTYYLRGKIQLFGAQIQIVQPKIISEVGTIKPVYKTTAQNRTIIALMKKYLTKDALLAEGIGEEHAANLMRIHFPEKDDLPNLLEFGKLSKEHIRTIKFTEIYRYLRRMAGKKRHFPALYNASREPDGFIQNLPFTLTDDQQTAIKTIHDDMNQTHQARRIVIGDVGCGKTMVMLATAYMAHPNKAVIMAPTTILANQLFEEAKKFLPADMHISLHTQKSNLTPDELKASDLIVGTHALLHTELPEVAVVMIDEQHRFGTKQRHELSLRTQSEEKKLPHIFQFSATPIPRTQAMVESTLIDVTFIRQVPFQKDIDTTVIGKSDFKKLLEHIKSEIALNHQILVVYPLVEASENIDYQSIDEAKAFWEKNFEGVYSTHGKDRDKDKVLVDFRENGNILLATTVVEVGISLPRLTTVVISGAERLGLATLHQLKGRVSRTGLKGYCYLYTNQNNSERLNEFIKTKNGFEVAELDLKFRKSGDLLDGIAQSGEHFEYFDMRDDGDVLQEAKKLIN